SPIIGYFIKDYKDKKRNVASLSFKMAVKQSSFLVGMGNSKIYYSLICEVVNHGERGIYTKSLNLVYFHDLIKISTVPVIVHPIKKLDPEIPVRISIGEEYLTSVPKKSMVDLKVIIIDTLGRTYESKIMRVDLTKFS